MPKGDPEHQSGGLTFEWDDAKRDKNWMKHGVRWSECEEVFTHRPLRIMLDVRHSKTEVRYGVLGQTEKGRLLAVFFTLRESRIRVISARDMSRNEAQEYGRAQEAQADSNFPQ